MTPPDRLRALLAKPGFVVMPAVWDGLSAKLAAGAGFVVAYAGDILTMPGLPKVPGAEGVDIDANGNVVGLF